MRLFFLLFAFSCFAHPPIEIVYHIATLNHWEEIVQEQLQTLESTQLGNAAERITITVVGPEFKRVTEIAQKTSFASKVDLIHSSEDPRFCEFPGIERVQEIAVEKPDSNIFYLHSKGVTYQDSDKARNVRSWRRYMEYFTIEKWEECVEILKTANTCGVEWLNCQHTSSQKIEKPGMFAGNFWWARADYLRTCPLMKGTHLGSDWCFKHRFDCEIFITTGQKPEPFSFHQSCVNLYQFNYSPEYYKDELVLQNPIEIVYHIVATPKWLDSFQEQFNFLHTSGLLASSNRLTAIIIGPEFEAIQQSLKKSPFFDKIKMVYAHSQLHLNEFPSIEMVKAIARKQPSAKVCYLHNHIAEPFVKPSSSIRQTIYRNYLNMKKELIRSCKTSLKQFFGKTSVKHATITRWKECIAALQTADLCGLKWKKQAPRGSSFPDILCRGYFTDHSWWAKAEYLNTCQNPHYRSPYHLYHAHWSESWTRQFFADCQMFTGTSHHEAIVHELIH